MLRSISRTGFTLIEILVVTTIISILSAILYANFTAARQDARNKVMRTTLGEIQLALEVFRAQNGFYPVPATTPVRVLIIGRM
jgi:general secretion pathway protein G